MIYGKKIFKNGKQRGYLEFKSGKKLILNNEEVKEFDFKIKVWGLK